MTAWASPVHGMSADPTSTSCHGREPAQLDPAQQQKKTDSGAQSDRLDNRVGGRGPKPPLSDPASRGGARASGVDPGRREPQLSDCWSSPKSF